MKFVYSCQTDRGTVRPVNQDALLVKHVNAGGHMVLLAAVCDGVGGLSCGELASGRAAQLLASWADYELPGILEQERAEELLRHRFRQLLLDINKEIFFENQRNGRVSGTTLTALLLWDYCYLAGHVGDSRLYAIGRRTVQLSQDHSWVAREVAAGRMTREEAGRDSRQNVILKCMGAEAEIVPQMIEGRIREPVVFLLCTDGFWHHIREEEWRHCFSPAQITGENCLGERLSRLIYEVKCRGEQDNITAAAVYVF